MSFQPGDLILQRGQAGAKPRLVLHGTDDPDVVVVWDDQARTYRKVHAWSHDLVAAATDVSREQAIGHTLSEAYERTTAPGNAW